MTLSPSLPLIGNDGAAEIALGGIRLKQERRVAMVKERLFISKKKVRVEYEFLNESKEDVTTEIAFPIPDYSFDIAYGWQPFEDFRVEVDGHQKLYQTEAKAFLGSKEITPILRDLHIRIETLGDFKEGTGYSPQDQAKGGKPSSSQMDSLPKEQQESLIKLGAVDGDLSDYRYRHVPLWTVKKTYHWSQTFPAGVKVRIAHEYSPCPGDAGYLDLEALEHPEKGAYSKNADPGCPDPELKRTMMRAIEKRNATDKQRADWAGSTFTSSWVRYILTTANTWKTPIRDFELVVERDPGEFVSFCWDGPVEKIGANTFRARMKDFVPSKELTVYFLQP